MLVLNTAGVGRARSERSWCAGSVFQPVEKWIGDDPALYRSSVERGNSVVDGGTA